MSITFTRCLNCFILLTLLLFPAAYSLREQCCKDFGVPEKCYTSLCNPGAIPEVMTRYQIFDPDYDCQSFLLPVSQCLSKGRDVTSCCWKKSYDVEFPYCFGLCNATMNYEVKKKKDNLSCFLLNVEAIFPCLVASYSNAPSQPRDLELVTNNEDSATFTWLAPAELPELVRVYKVHLIDRLDNAETETVFETTNLEFTFEDLTQESSYSVYVVAHGEIYKNNTEWNKSLFSNIVSFVTFSQIQLSQEDLKIPPSIKSIEMACHLKLITGAEPAVDWVKVTNEKLGDPIQNGTRHTVISYHAAKFSRDMVSSLKITNLEESDFGAYRCYIKDTRVEFGEVTLTSFIHSEEPPFRNPPESVLECCSRGYHGPECQSVCSANPADKKEVLRPEHYLAGKGCRKEFDRLFKCSMSPSNSAGCCIQKQVPFQCLGMCDSRFDIHTFRMAKCKKIMKTIYNCQLALMDLKPGKTSFVKAEYAYRGTYTFTWEEASDAKVYHIYSRRHKGKWLTRVTVDHAVDISDADEVVIISVNEYGSSRPYRLRYFDNDWHTVDH